LEKKFTSISTSAIPFACSRGERQPQCLECPKGLSESCLMKETSDASGCQADIDATISLDMSLRLKTWQLNKIQSMHIAESPDSTKKKTSSDKLSTCRTNSQDTLSSPTSVQESTSNDKVCKPFFDSRCLEMSRKLWLPTKTALQGLPVTYWSGSSQPTIRNSWSSITQLKASKETLPKTSWPLSTFSVAEQMVSEDIQKNTRKTKIPKTKTKKKALANCTRKIRIFPSPEDKAKLTQWLGCHRVVYNRALAFANKTKNRNYTEMGKRFVASRNIKEKWLLECPQVIRSVAIRDLRAAFDSNFAKMAINPEHHFELKFKSKKEGAQACRIEAKNSALKITKDGLLSFFPKSLKPMRFEKKSLEGINFNYDVTIVKDKLGRFSLHIPYHRENQPVKESMSWCAVDPGVRTFATVYSPTAVLKIGDGAATRLSRLLLCMDNLMSLRSTTKGVQKKRRMGKAITRMRFRIQNLTKELHCQAANCLTREFTDIVLPPFETQKMAARLGRKLTKKTTRNMLTLSHYKFRVRLQNKAVSRGCRVHVLGEEYTSKTCTRCGTIKANLGGAKEYKCSHCDLIIDRDVAGARNIFLKNISGP